MGKQGKLQIKSVGKEPAIVITRTAIKKDHVVYLAIANKPIKYPHGKKSTIIYIGTTKNGIDRIVKSARNKALELLDGHGFNKLTFYLVTCNPKQKVKTWKKLESALILTFREKYGKVPELNTQGKKQEWSNEHYYFTSDALVKTIEKYDGDKYKKE